MELPPEALKEYGLKESEKLILLPGSRTSGGFGLGSQESVSFSPLGVVLTAHSMLREYRTPEGELVEYEGKPYCWVELRNGGILLFCIANNISSAETIRLLIQEEHDDDNQTEDCAALVVR